MPIWTIAAVSKEPQTTLDGWAIYELTNGDRHFSGYAVEAREGRVSSRIEEFDVKTMRGVSRSGRVYQLRGKPGMAPQSDSAYVWRRWKELNEVEVFVDVGPEVWAEHQGR
jgi:hypothetical protein